jgi:hypothetical protein
VVAKRPSSEQSPDDGKAMTCLASSSLRGDHLGKARMKSELRSDHSGFTPMMSELRPDHYKCLEEFLKKEFRFSYYLSKRKIRGVNPCGEDIPC